MKKQTIMIGSFALLGAFAAPAISAAQAATRTAGTGSLPANGTDVRARRPVQASGAAPSIEASVGGYVEAFYAFNLGLPSNGITNFRGFDSRHNTFTIANAVVDASLAYGPVGARIALQIGTTPETYYGAEPQRRGTDAVGASNASIWKYIQQAYATARVPVARGLTIDAGIMLSPIGIESMMIHANFNWSRSSTFYGLPFYHTGVRVSYAATERFTATAHLYNGWNSVTDNNDGKTVIAQIQYRVPDRVALSVLYCGGPERETGAREGQAWRNLLDANVMVHATPWLSFYALTIGGLEANNFGVSWFFTAASAIRFRVARWLYLSARADVFYEAIPGQGVLRARPIFWAGASVMTSPTATVELRPFDNLSVMLEYRHDHSDANLFFRGSVARDPLSDAFVTNANSQDTITLGMTTWIR